MLYYTELEQAAQFYGQTLGLTATMNDDWVKLYEVIPGSLLGLVKAGGTAYHKTQDTNAVMVSIVTEDVDIWYAIVSDNPNIEILKPLYNHATVPIRAFLVADPGGYTVEIFQWLK
jgi:catechol-2,3-dioxygenase